MSYDMGERSCEYYAICTMRTNEKQCDRRKCVEYKLRTRPVGEHFDCNGVLLKVVIKNEDTCTGCYFEKKMVDKPVRLSACLYYRAQIGSCRAIACKDGIGRIFKEEV